MKASRVAHSLRHGKHALLRRAATVIRCIPNIKIIPLQEPSLKQTFRPGQEWPHVGLSSCRTTQKSGAVGTLAYTSACISRTVHEREAYNGWTRLYSP